MNRLPELIQLAHVAREQVELINETARLHQWVDKLKPNLGGGCGTASLHLLNMAKKNGINPIFVHGEFKEKTGSYPSGHCWIEYCNVVVDITATQFLSPCPKVYVQPLSWRAGNYLPRKKFKNIEEAEKSVLQFACYAPELRQLV